MSPTWRDNNAITLLENGEEFLCRITDVIDQARTEVLIETFILRDDPVGRQIQETLIRAARRGVWVALLVDGYGSYYLPEAFVRKMVDAGIVYAVYHPQPSWLFVRANIFKRMHRKILVADGKIAFVGGINLEYSHLPAFGPDSKQDYAVELTGPVVKDIHRFAREALQNHTPQPVEFVQLPPDEWQQEPAGQARVLFVTRDNHKRRTSIENQYLEQIRNARERITIANCYFFPGYRILKALRDAARRGVKVCLLTQGKPDSVLAKRAAYTLYDFLVESDIQVFEYWEKPLHGKIAAFDDKWATVGSSNMDPLSFCLNLEANVFVEDADFNARVHERILYLIDHSEVRPINPSWLRRRTLLKGFVSFLIYHLLRHLPGLTAWVPRLERSNTFVPPVAGVRRQHSEKER